MPREQRPMLEVKQWMPSWDHATWGHDHAKPMPPPGFFVCSLPIVTLRALSGINARTKDQRKLRSKEAGYQRAHESERSRNIGRYLQYGYPLSSSGGLEPLSHVELINPGWLPTAILVNVLGPDDERLRGARTLKVAADHLVKIARDEGRLSIDFPIGINFSNEDLPPLEVIDGQHRLLATDLIEDGADGYEVPVVVFDRLALAWQAYLFWVINVEPRKINPSLAFDLYPELRNQDWLERGEAIKIYQEHRAQELAEALWKHPESPWFERIELFGKRVEGHVSNAAVIRSLGATFVRRWGKVNQDEEVTRLGGLFGSLDKFGQSYVLPWKRSQQAAFLIACWQAVQRAALQANAEWARALRESNPSTNPAFTSGYSLLATDQGFRAVCFVFNAMSQTAFEQLRLADWFTDADSEPAPDSVAVCLREIEAQKQITSFIHAVATQLVTALDWRTSSAPGLDDRGRVDQGQFRGSSGYAALNRAAVRALANARDESVRAAATRVLEVTGWGHGQ